MHEPQTLSKIYRLAQLAEATLAANARALMCSHASMSSTHLKKPSYEPHPTKATPITTTSNPRLVLPPSINAIAPRNRRTICPTEMQARRAQVSEGEGVDVARPESEGSPSREEWSTVEGDTSMISIYALSGLQGAQTIHVTGYSKTRSIQIFLDGGSTHNLINEKAAKRLGCQICPTRMKILGPITMDYFELIMAFNYHGKYHLLRGVSEKCKVSSPKSLNKLKGEDVQFFMLQVMDNALTSASVMQCQALHMDKSDNAPPIEELLQQYQLIFAEPTTLPPQMGALDHRIPLQPGSKPMNARPYKYSAIKKDIIEKLVNEMLQQGVIQYSNSLFSSPVVLVGKKDGLWRLCVDYRELNQCTVKDKFPISLIDDLLDELVGATIFSKIDLRSGYHQIRMMTDDVPKIAFKTHLGNYEYLVMPFGLTNAPSTFQCLMNHLFQKFLRKLVLVFFDDILIYNVSLQDHLVHLQQVFDIMVTHSLLAKQSKCAFGISRVEYLGNFISGEGVSTDPRKIQAVQQWPTPTTLKKLRGFLWIAGYYRKFIRGYGVIALSNYAIPFVVETDASGTCIWVVLIQFGHPIAFISKGLAPRHVSLSVYEKELLALVFAVTKWSHYLLGQHFIVKIDQKARKYLLEQKLHTDSQIRWLAELLPFDFEIQYKKEKENMTADSLSIISGVALMTLMEKPQKHFTWINNQLRRKGINMILLLQLGHFIALVHPYTTQSLVSIFLDQTFKLHGFPGTITSDRDPIFISAFWKEFLSARGITLHTSTAYHPQTDGQTELNGGITPPLILQFRPLLLNCFMVTLLLFISFYISGDSSSDSVENIMLLLEFKMQLAKYHLARSQQRMQDQANAHRTDKYFSVGDWVFVKLQPYRQFTLSVFPYHKLISRYFGPYPIIEKICAVA
nr:uncharacterized protein LOC104110514 [Nicotiana tomentosiformis]